MGFYEIPVDIRAFFWYSFCTPRAFRRVEYRKNTKKLHNTFEVLNTDIFGMKYRLLFYNLSGLANQNQALRQDTSRYFIPKSPRTLELSA